MLNQCQFIGHIGNDPEIKTTNSGSKIANLSLAVTEKWKNKQGERQERTEWVRLNCFQEGLIGVIESYVKKGSKIFVSGKMATRKWQTQEGQDRYSTEINIDKLVMLDSRDNSGGNYGAAQQGQAGNFSNDMDDDVPFGMEWR
jgi:single-strand DNA-binding protein